MTLLQLFNMRAIPPAPGSGRVHRLSDESPVDIDRHIKPDAFEGRKTNKSIEVVYAVLTEHPQSTQRIMDRVGFGRTTVQDSLNKLVQQGKALRVDLRGTNGYFWRKA